MPRWGHIFRKPSVWQGRRMLRKLSLSLRAQTQWRWDVCGATKERCSLCLAGADRIPKHQFRQLLGAGGIHWEGPGVPATKEASVASS